MAAAAAAAFTSHHEGILLLDSLDEVKIRQKHRFAGHKYLITTTDGQEVFMAKEESTTVLGVIFRGGAKDRTFHMAISDLQGREVFRLRRPFTYGPDKMQVIIGRRLACTVRQQRTCMTTLFWVNDSSDRMRLRVKGHKFDNKEYEIQTPDKQTVGRISKCWAGWAKEIFTNVDNYHITFPRNIDVDYKAALIGVCILIDYMHFSGE